MLRVPYLGDTRIAAAAGAVELVSDGILLVVVLVILLGWVERARLNDFGIDMWKVSVFLKLGFARFGRLTLAWVQIEDRAAVLTPVIAELLILDGGIDVVPEVVEQLRVRDLVRVVVDQHRFRVAGATAAHLLVGGIL